MITFSPRLIACALATSALSMAVSAQADTASAYKAPRDGFGRPDLSGTWSNESLTRMERPVKYADHLVATPQDVATEEGARAVGLDAIKNKADPNREICEKPATAFLQGCGYSGIFLDAAPHLARVNGQPRTSFITFPANGRIPRRPDDKPRPDGWGAGNADNPENRGLPDRCIVSQNISTGAILNPTVYNNTYLFQQNKDTVVVVTEMSHDARTIRLNAQHDNIPRFFGDSIGHWEGETLVVDTVHFDPAQLEYNSPALHVTERFTRVGADRILYQFKVEDPGAYTQPWGGEYEFHTASAPQYEYACHEGNYAMEGILSGARQEEAKAKLTGQPVARVASGAEGE